MPTALRVQIQASLGEGHVNIIEAKEAILTDTHLCLVMEYAAGQVLTGDRQLREEPSEANMAPSMQTTCPGGRMLKILRGIYSTCVQIRVQIQPDKHISGSLTPHANP